MKLLKLMALLEGTSLLLLLFVAMPLKYHYGMPEYVSIVGRAHGALFIAFNLILFYQVSKGLVTPVQGFIGFLASLVPFGTFIYKAKALNKKTGA
jgi:integral membrane protein